MGQNARSNRTNTSELWIGGFPQERRPLRSPVGICYHLAGIAMDEHPMKAIELVGDIDDQHRLHADVPKELPAGQVRLIVLLPDEDEAGGVWARGVAQEWSADLADQRQDLYTLEDGQPVNAPW
jgi:hypothetical protein